MHALRGSNTEAQATSVEVKSESFWFLHIVSHIVSHILVTQADVSFSWNL